MLQAHMPASQCDPPLHFFPQPPQLLSSACVGMHEPLHGVSPITHWFAQVPAEQSWTELQGLPHMPQFFGSVLRLTQAPLQSVFPEGHTHWPITHVPPGSHCTPHPPQLLTLLEGSTQRPLQNDRPGVEQASWQVPDTHVAPIGHWLPHAPQLFGSLIVSVQVDASAPPTLDELLPKRELHPGAGTKANATSETIAASADQRTRLWLMCDMTSRTPQQGKYPSTSAGRRRREFRGSGPLR
jgi:hypothetical protein